VERTKKEGILVEAARAFARFGFRKASIDAIARKAGVAKGTVYLAAESKEDLFYQVLHREVRTWIAEVATSIDPRRPADELLATCSNAGIEYLEAHPLVKELLFGQAHLLLPSWADRLDELSALGRENVIQILKLGIRQGLFREDLDVEIVAELLLDLQLAYFVLHDRAPKRDVLFARRRQAALDLVLNGIRKH
jgi:TetR/AcrR family fatty acid metabolism transcriptional regulator